MKSNKSDYNPLAPKYPSDFDIFFLIFNEFFSIVNNILQPALLA